MHFPKMKVAAVLLLSGIQLIPLSVVAQTKEQTSDTVELGIYGKKKSNGDHDLLCTIPFPAPKETKEYRFKRHPTDGDADVECVSDEAYYFKIEGNATSAVVLSFFDDTDCEEREDQKFWFRLRTIKQVTTMTEPYRIKSLAEHPIKQVIVPGVQLIGKYVEPGDNTPIDGKLSCVKIAMPTPAT